MEDLPRLVQRKGEAASEYGAFAPKGSVSRKAQTPGRYRADGTHSVEQQDRQARQLFTEPRATLAATQAAAEHDRLDNKVDHANPANDAPNRMICVQQPAWLSIISAVPIRQAPALRNETLRDYSPAVIGPGDFPALLL